MTIFLHELKRGKISFLIWTAAIALMLFVCMMLFPEMQESTESMGDLFANMGSFTAAFGMDQVNFGEVMGFYAIECGNILGIGGGFFAALLGIAALSKEEKERTAEFLLTHPISRAAVVGQKLLAVLAQLLFMNAVVLAVSVASFALIGEQMAVKELLLLHAAYVAMQVEIACICFGLSAFLQRGSMGIGLGLAAVLYFLNLVANISEQAEFLRYITPFAYAEASEIVSTAELDGVLLFIGFVYTLIGCAAAYVRYTRKDISA